MAVLVGAVESRSLVGFVVAAGFSLPEKKVAAPVFVTAVGFSLPGKKVAAPVFATAVGFSLPEKKVGTPVSLPAEIFFEPMQKVTPSRQRSTAGPIVTILPKHDRLNQNSPTSINERDKVNKTGHKRGRFSPRVFRSFTCVFWDRVPTHPCSELIDPKHIAETIE